MKKTLIALAVAGIGFNAMAADLDKPGQDLPVFASELALPGVINAANAAADELNVVTTVGGTIVGGVDTTPTNADKNIYVRIDLTDAKFQTDLAKGNLTITDANGAVAGVTSEAVAGGADGQTTAVFTIKIAGDAVTANILDATDTLNLSLVDLEVTGKTPSIQYRLYLDSDEASFGSSTNLVSKSGQLASFAPAIEKIEVTDAVAELNVSKFYKEFLDTTTGNNTATSNVISTLKLVGKDDVYLASGKVAEGSVHEMLTLADSTVAITGNFAAGVKDGNGDLDLANIITGGANNGDSTEGTIVRNLTAMITDSQDFILNIDGETALDEYSYTAVFKPASVQVDAADVYNLDDVTFDPFATLEKSGDSAKVEFALNANSSFNQFVRLIHDGAVDAEIFVTVKDDTGLSTTFPLSEVEGQDGQLVSGTAAKSVSVKSLFAIAKAQEPALDDKGMLRLEFGGDIDDITAQSYVVGADGSAFGQVN